MQSRGERSDCGTSLRKDEEAPLGRPTWRFCRYRRAASVLPRDMHESVGTAKIRMSYSKKWPLGLRSRRRTHSESAVKLLPRVLAVPRSGTLFTFCTNRSAFM